MRSKLFVFLFVVTILSFAEDTAGQIKVVIMGSSTAVGSGATTYQLSWAGRLKDHHNINTSDGLDTIFYNIAKVGYSTYQEMPSSFIPPLGRPLPDPLYNVTKALSYNPEVVIINLPSNDVGAGFTTTEIMNNFRLMHSSITSSGAKCFITTTQPRNDYSILQRQTLLEIVDSINVQFGLFAINFWDDLITSEGLYMLRDDRRDIPSPVHPNDIGHNFLFQRVRDKNIFGMYVLPVVLTGFSANLINNNVMIKWHSEQQEPNTNFIIERSSNGIDFAPIYYLQVPEARQQADYSAADNNLLPGKNYYRIKVTAASRQFYSNTISILNKTSRLSISNLYKDYSASHLICQIGLQKMENIFISIYNAAGAILQQKKQFINTPSTQIILSISNLTAGQYYIKISTDDNTQAIKAFTK